MSMTDPFCFALGQTFSSCSGSKFNNIIKISVIIVYPFVTHNTWSYQNTEEKNAILDNANTIYDVLSKELPLL